MPLIFLSLIYWTGLDRGVGGQNVKTKSRLLKTNILVYWVP